MHIHTLVFIHIFMDLPILDLYNSIYTVCRTFRGFRYIYLQLDIRHSFRDLLLS